MAKTASTKARAKELERVITHLDTLYEQGEDCKHPDTGIVEPTVNTMDCVAS